MGLLNTTITVIVNYHDKVLILDFRLVKTIQDTEAKHVSWDGDKRIKRLDKEQTTGALTQSNTTETSINRWQLAKMKKSIPDMSLSWNL